MGNYNWDIDKLRYLSGLAEQPNQKSKSINEENETVDNQEDNSALLERIEQEYDGGELNEQGVEDQRLQDDKILKNKRKQMGFFPAIDLAGIGNLYPNNNPNNGKIVSAFISKTWDKQSEATMAETMHHLKTIQHGNHYDNDYKVRQDAEADINPFMAATNKMIATKMKASKK